MQSIARVTLDGPLCQQRSEILAVDELHDEKMPHLGLVGIVGHDDIRMSKTGDRLHFPLEPLHKGCVVGQARDSTLRATMRFMRRWRALEDRPHAARAQAVEHIVISDAQLGVPVFVHGFTLVRCQSS